MRDSQGWEMQRVAEGLANELYSVHRRLAVIERGGSINDEKLDKQKEREMNIAATKVQAHARGLLSRKKGGASGWREDDDD